MIELSVLKYLLVNENYNNIRDSIDISDFSKESHSIIRTIDTYFKTVDNPQDLTVDDLSNLYFSTNRGKQEYYVGVFEALRQNDSSSYSTEQLIGSLKKTRLLREVSLEAYDLSEGRGDYDKFLTKLTGLKDEEKLNDDQGKIDFVSTDLSELVAASYSVPGLRWRLDSLNKTLGSLRKSDFGFLFARPETGKTTFLASEVTHFATQVTQPIIWLNNEEVGSKVMLRCYQAALGVPLENLLRDIEGNRKRYLEITKDNIKLYDSASISKNQVEKICEKFKPSLVVFDQIDKIKGFDNDREDLRLGSIYIWARELAKQYCPVIGVCQADGTGEGQQWLSMANVANAKTSKQAEADWILGIGKRNEPGYDNLRFLHLSKNKLMGDEDTNPNRRHDRFETLIEPTIARYRDL